MTSSAFLCLGTVQTGMAYGAASQHGLMSEAEAFDIYDAALAAGVTCFDTAAAYGLAEQRIGAWRARRQSPTLRIITKFSKLADMADGAVEQHITSQVETSCRNLGVTALDGLLAHSAADIRRPVVQHTLRRLRDARKIRVFGASVYEPGEAAQALEMADLGLLQIPINLFNQAFHGHAVLREAVARNIEVHARSIYLQGLLLLAPTDLPAFAQPWASTLRRLHDLCDAHACDLDSLALAAVATEPGIGGLLVGCDTADQVRQNVRAFDAMPAAAAVTAAWAACRDVPPDMADPRRWPKRAQA